MNQTITFVVLVDNLHGNYEYKKVNVPITNLYNADPQNIQATYNRNEEALDRYFDKYCRKQGCVYLELGNPQKYPDPNALLD